MSTDRGAPAQTGDETVTLWRCEACGKWSHAARRPSHHKRMVLDDDELFDEDNEQQPRILETFVGHATDTGAPEASFYIACGPFAEYRAERAS